jgi:hypothetical protein
VTAQRWTFSMAGPPPKDLDEAREQFRRVKELANTVIKIMTAEQALLAQKVVREAGRRDRR